MARLIRRLSQWSASLAMDFVQRAADFQGKRPYGPASAFAVYCANVGWSIQPDGLLKCSTALSCNLLRDPLPCILHVLKSSWPQVLIQQIDRKGVGDFIPDLSISHRILRVFPDEDQQLLLFLIMGAFQVETIKHK